MGEDRGQQGRQYHDSDSVYILPNDNPEHQRLEVQAIAFEKLMNGTVFRAPVQRPRRVLDIGCGTGRATIQLAARFPDAQVIGVDLSRVPQIHDKPKNVEYVQGDIRELVRSAHDCFQKGSFDYVFHRLLIFGLTDWPGYFNDVSTLLAPGGWAEAQEVDAYIKDANDDAVDLENRAIPEFVHLSAMKGMDVRVGSHLRALMETTGLGDVQESVFWWPILPFPEKPETDMVQVITFKLPFAMAEIWDRLGQDVHSKEKIQELKEEYKLLHDMSFRKKGEHYNFHVVCGQKSAA